jgi:carbon storage regulator
MLVLSRKIGERIVVPECNLMVTVVAIEGNKVRLGFSAPAELGVYREEVWQEIEEEEGQVGQSSGRIPIKVDAKDSNPFFLTVFHPGDQSHE